MTSAAVYDPEADEELIARAYSTAHAAHKDQVRKSGEPFVCHPLATADVLAELPIDTPNGGQVELGDVADVQIRPNPTVIRHEAVSRYIDVAADVSGRSRGSVVSDVERRLEEAEFPLEYHAEVLGESTELNAAQDRLLLFGAIAAVAVSAGAVDPGEAVLAPPGLEGSQRRVGDLPARRRARSPQHPPRPDFRPGDGRVTVRARESAEEPAAVDSVRQGDSVRSARAGHRVDLRRAEGDVIWRALRVSAQEGLRCLPW